MERSDISRPNQSAINSDLNHGDQSSETDEAATDSVWSEASSSIKASTSPRHARDLERGRAHREPFSLPHRSRPLQQRRTASASHVPIQSSADPMPSTTTFESPLRSIFVSGLPTASVSANTAIASLSAAAPSSSSGSFAALSNAGGTRRIPLKPGEGNQSVSAATQPLNRPPFINLEKDVDDPNVGTAVGSPDNGFLDNSVTLSRLFVASEESTPGPPSRGLSHLRSFSAIGRTLNDTSTLTGHLFHHGFMEGRHSDITVFAFGDTYRLHKLLLDRVPYFASAFSGAWAESSAKEMVLHPEEIDANITKSGFELAIKRIYGTHFSIHEDQEAIGLFATACWLDMPDLVDCCVESILRQMQPSTLHELIRLVTNNYYGKAGDRILSSAKAMLCREGWEMPYECWDNIPAETIREIIGGDPFFIPSEWERWFLAVKILNRRLKAKAVENSLASPTGQFFYPKPTSLRFFAIRFDATYRRETGLTSPGSVTDKDQPWISLYTSPEVSPLLVLLDEGIHYVHLRFEQLQQIRLHRDVLGVPILPEKVISDALWMSMELRQRILNAHENDLELGLTEEAEDQDEAITEGRPVLIKGKQREGSMEEAFAEQDMESNSWDGNGRPRKFWIPSNDVSCVVGGTREANIGGSTVGAEWTTNAARLSASLEPTDVTWASDFALDGGRPVSQAACLPRYSHFPPFRFSAEFPTPRSLKEKKRVYSQTVWYAGSMWNLYIQRVSTSKSQQLGIYLHRAKDGFQSDDPLAQVMPATVDDRIGQLEREMLLRKTERRNRQWRAENNGGREMEDELAAMGQTHSSRGGAGNLDERSILDIPSMGLRDVFKSPEYGRPSVRSPTSNTTRFLDSDEEDDELLSANRRYNVPAMPPYLDGRPVIKTYFKIYSPDKAGRLLSIYESAPEKFVVSKSWGWKSSQMVYDDGGNSYDMSRGVKDGKLRYMVVIGNV